MLTPCTGLPTCAADRLTPAGKSVWKSVWLVLPSVHNTEVARGIRLGKSRSVRSLGIAGGPRKSCRAEQLVANMFAEVAAARVPVCGVAQWVYCRCSRRRGRRGIVTEVSGDRRSAAGGQTGIGRLRRGGTGRRG